MVDRVYFFEIFMNHTHANANTHAHTNTHTYPSMGVRRASRRPDVTKFLVKRSSAAQQMLLLLIFCQSLSRGEGYSIITGHRRRGRRGLKTTVGSVMAIINGFVVASRHRSTTETSTHGTGQALQPGCGGVAGRTPATAAAREPAGENFFKKSETDGCSCASRQKKHNMHIWA